MNEESLNYIVYIKYCVIFQNKLDKIMQMREQLIPE